MPFQLRCNMCGESLAVEDSQVGSILNCPSCGQVIFVQLPAGRTDSAVPPHEPVPEPAPPAWMQPAAGPPMANESDLLLQADTQSSLADMMAISEQSSEQSAAPGPSPLSAAAPTVPRSPAAEAQAEQWPASDLPQMPWDSEPVDSGTFVPADPAKPASDPSPVAAGTTPQESFPWAPADQDAAAEPAADFDFSSAPVVESFAPADIPPPAERPVPGDAPAKSEFADFLRQDGMNAPLPSADKTDAAHAPSSTLEPRPRSSAGSLAFAYASGIILGLIVGRFLFGGRSSPTGLELIRDDGVNMHKTQWIRPTEPVPSSQKRPVGETVELGHLAVTALGVERRKVVLERVDPFSGAKETTSSAEECLVLRVRLKNTSQDVAFVPLDETFLRPHDPKRRPNYSFIELAGGTQIPMYELSEFSEWNIVGQPMQVIRPGEEQEAIIVAESGSADRVTGPKMLWRIQVRAGGPKDRTYSTVVGFEFGPEQIRAETS